MYGKWLINKDMWKQNQSGCWGSVCGVCGNCGGECGIIPHSCSCSLVHIVPLMRESIFAQIGAEIKFSTEVPEKIQLIRWCYGVYLQIYRVISLYYTVSTYYIMSSGQYSVIALLYSYYFRFGAVLPEYALFQSLHCVVQYWCYLMQEFLKARSPIPIK